MEDDACANVRHDTEGKYSRLSECTAGKRVVQAEQVIRIFEVFCQDGSVNSGDGDVSANTVDDQKTEREEDLLAQIRDLKRIDERIDGFLECFH